MSNLRCNSTWTIRSARCCAWRRVHEVSHAPFMGLNRAQARGRSKARCWSAGCTCCLPDKVDTEMAYLQIAIDKTAGPEEREAWGWLREAVATHRAKRGGMMRLLVSVRSVDEALLAAGAGADFIDLKDPGRGCARRLAGGEHCRHRRCAAAGGRVTLPVSATIGDLPMHALREIQARVDAVGCLWRRLREGRHHRATPGRARCSMPSARCGAAVVPVFIADRGSMRR